MWHRDKAVTRTVLNELRQLWNEFDPIDVMHMAEDGWKVDDEYDAYLGQTLTHLGSDNPETDLENYLAYVVYNRMGLSQNGYMQEKIKKFIPKLQDWYITVEKRLKEAKK